jgi:hypothetical protein
MHCDYDGLIMTRDTENLNSDINMSYSIITAGRAKVGDAMNCFYPGDPCLESRQRDGLVILTEIVLKCPQENVRLGHECSRLQLLHTSYRDSFLSVYGSWGVDPQFIRQESNQVPFK